MLITLNAPFVGAIPYLYFYGFDNWWIIAGLVLWTAGGVIAKIIKIPVYKKIAALEDGDADRLGEVRRKLNAGNLFQAIVNSAAIIVMLIGLF